MGNMDKDGSFKLLDAYYDFGGNFIDTANNYQDGESEAYIGEWMEKRGNRSEMVIATKYTTFYEPKANYRANYAGNHIKSMVTSVEASLKKLRTSYIDILYLHWWEYTTSIEEVMQGLNNLVKQGKVLYLGISDTPAWIVSKANQYAEIMVWLSLLSIKVDGTLLFEMSSATSFLWLMMKEWPSVLGMQWAEASSKPKSNSKSEKRMAKVSAN